VYYGSDPREVVNVVRGLNADAVLLQEATSTLAEVARDELPEFSQLFVESALHSNGTTEGLMILSRQPIRDPYVGILRHGGKAPWKGGAASQRLYIDVDLGMENGDCLRVGNIYPSYPLPLGIGDSKWSAETNAILKALQGRKPHIVGGDFNATPESDRMRVILGETGYVSIPTHKVGMTWTGRGIIRVPDGRRRLDYILVDSSKIEGRGRIFDSNVSDHRPLKANLKMKL